MKMKKIIAMLLTVTILVTCAASSARKAPAATGAPKAEAPVQTEASAETGTRIITDRRGRQVEIPNQVNTIVCLGSGAPRIAAYLQVTDRMIGVEDCDTGDVSVLRDYSWVCHDELKDRPSCGSGGGSGQNNAYPEQIIELQPDVILAGFTAESAEKRSASKYLASGATYLPPIRSVGMQPSEC